MIEAIEGRRADDAERLAREHMARAMEVRIRLLRDGADPRAVDLVSWLGRTDRLPAPGADAQPSGTGPGCRS